MNKLNRRRFLQLGGGAMAGAMMLGPLGCGGQENQGSTTEASGALALSIMGTDEQRKDFYAALTGAFQQESGRQVRPTYVGWDQGRQQLVTRTGGGNPPDASYLAGRWLGGFEDLGVLAPVGSAVTEGFVEGAVQGVTINGEVYGLPWGFSTRALFYRSDLFEEAGIEPPRSWEAMLEAARELNGRNDEVHGFGIAGAEETATAAQFMIWIWAAGGEIVSQDGTQVAFDSEAGVEALSRYVGLVEEGLTEPGAITNGEGDLHSLFRQGRLAMVITGPWMRSLMQEENSPVQMDENAAVMPLPPWQTQATLNTVDTLSVFSDGRTEGATEFLEFAAQDEWRWEYFQLSGQQPVKQSIIQRPEFQNDPYWAEAFIPSADFGRAYPKVAAWEEIESALISAVQKALNGTAPEEALAAAAKEANSALQQA